MARNNHFIKNTETWVEDMLNGIAATYPSVTIDTKSGVILHIENEPYYRRRKVGLLSGGGSGHEPFAAGFVGEGMLTGAVAGKVFTSPPPSSILTAICNIAAISSDGVLVIFNNYTGDNLNFGIAMEKANLKGYKVKCISIDEDCAIDEPKGAGKRGLCGCLFVIKIGGGLAAMGEGLDEIYNECLEVKQNIATLGVTIKPCNMPGLGPMFEMEEGFMELGVGIHGEAGAMKSKMAPADEIACILVNKLCQTLQVKTGDRVCIIVNNLGGTPQLELFLMSGLVCSELRSRNIIIERHYSGTLVTSLDMAGLQVSLLVLPSDIKKRTSWLLALDCKTTAFAWPGTLLSLQQPQQRQIIPIEDNESQITGTEITEQEAETLKKCLKAAAEALAMNELKLNELDRGCGDGDTGSTLRRLADALIQNIDYLPVKYPQQCFTTLSKMAEKVMGGTSGALYSLMFVGASKQVPSWTSAWQAALKTAVTYSKATEGSRTMFDALIPALETYINVLVSSKNWQEALKKAVEAADEGCQRTIHQKPFFGRASYVGEENIKDMDAGAFAVTVWLHAIRCQLIK